MNYLIAMACIVMGTVIAALLGDDDLYWLIVSDINVAVALFIAWACEKRN